jgi:hypothetical protein
MHCEFRLRHNAIPVFIKGKKVGIGEGAADEFFPLPFHEITQHVIHYTLQSIGSS